MPLIHSILQRLKAKADAKPRRRRTPFRPLEALEMRILLSASVLDNSTLTNDVVSQGVLEVINDPVAIDPTAIDTTAIDTTAIDPAVIDNRGVDILNGGSQDEVNVDNFGNAYLQRSFGNDLADGKQFDKNLFPTDGYGGSVIFTMGLNPAGSIQETPDTGTASDWISNSNGNDLIKGGNPDDTLLYPVDPVVYDFLPRDVGNDIVSAETWGGVQNFGAPVPMMFQAGAGQPADFGNAAAADAGNNSGMETLNARTDGSPVLSGVGNDATNGIISQVNLVGGTAPNLPVNGTVGNLVVSSSNHNEGDVRGLWLLFADANQASSSETPVDLTADDQSGTDGDVLSNSTPVSGGESDADPLTQTAGTDSLIARSSLDGLADTAVDEVFTHLDSHV